MAADPAPAQERLQYIRDLPGCVRNGKLGSGSGLLAAANISDHCTSGVTPKADVQDFSLNFRNVLEVAVPGRDFGRRLPTLLRPSLPLNLVSASMWFSS